jgi:hypothetical protein
MSGIDIALRLLGAFYIVAGVLVVRAFAMSRLLDHAIERLTGEGDGRAAALRAAWNVATAVFTFAGGMALLLLWEGAAVLFAASLAWQALYIGWVAPRLLDPTDPPDPAEQQQAINAAAIYSAATGWVLWAWWHGRLVPWSELPAGLVVAGGVSVACMAGYVVWAALRPPQFGSGSIMGEFRVPDDVADDGFHPASARQIKVMAEIDSHPLWVMDDGRHFDVPPTALGLSDDLGRELVRWSDTYAACLGIRDERGQEACLAQHAADGRRLAERLAEERPHIEVLVVEAGTGVVPVHGGGRGG